MPTFTTIALENLLEHRNSGKNSSTLKNPQPSTNENDEATEEKRAKTSKRLNHIYISPALYTTPEPTPILDYSSSGSLSSSPYVFNRKGRGGGKSANRRVDGFEVEGNGSQSVGNGGEVLQGGEEELVESSLFGGGENENGNFMVVEDEGECADDDDDDDDGEFVDPRCDSFSVGSSSELNDSGRIASMSVLTNQIGEFYDAIEDFSSDGSMLSVASCSRNIESELCATKLSLLEEIEKRKTAENNVAMMCSRIQRMGKLLVCSENDSSWFDINAMEQLCQQVIVGRYVAEAVGKAEAQVEAEVAAEVIIGSKDKEISRLRDRLQYYEAMIHEMSQKNVESMEVARRQRERKRGERKWLWSCVGMSIVIGASIIAYSYAPLPHVEAEAEATGGGY
ncbi:uncharacterized protein LOC112508135 [Cynara cardunculus var. scolymus]|uniref:Uncharacterized protein n=1 Tax=Cynara cardunculus var. scolymus TaxID=59895 RepID=A0A118K6S9_CYNCS|nr:uncharacterized protein LOC112508135 [Cynara cardunculus var. scolymus]KVI11161.1 hypothetical protein Ccrd_010433 [Cynara cardunculus var. scolymus]